MELKTSYQYTYFIHPFVIKDEQYQKYILKLLKDKDWNLKIFQKEKDFKLYKYFLPKTREFLFSSFSFSNEKLKQLEELPIETRAALLAKYQCNIFEYSLKKDIQAKVQDKSEIFLKIQKIEVTIPVKGNIIRSEQVSNDMYVSIDLVDEVIERQLRKYKTKIVDKKQEGGNFQKAYIENDYMEDEEIRIIRSKKFGMKPMFPEDACVQMELLGHNFYVFRNAETDEVNVVYKRKGNTYGLIEPEF